MLELIKDLWGFMKVRKKFWLLRNGKVLSMNEEEVLREADRVSREIWFSYFKDHPDLEMPNGFDTRVSG